MTLQKIDTSYWKKSDPKWVKAREAYWPKVEFMLLAYKTKKKGLNPIKDYYLRGKMPNWKSFKDWGDIDRHLDIFLFLWLHPSWDEAVLTELRNLYINSDLIVYRDVAKGISNFLDSQAVIASNPHYRSMKRVGFPYIEGHGELLFKVLFGDPTATEIDLECQAHYKIRKPYSSPGRPKYKPYFLPVLGYSMLCLMGRWLCTKKMLPIHEDFLFQYDQPLEWWYKGLATQKDFFKDDYNQRSIWSYQEALYCIHHFNTDEEGDTCRTQFVEKIRKILDEREVAPEIEEIWAGVKSGKIVVENAWEF